MNNISMFLNVSGIARLLELNDLCTPTAIPPPWVLRVCRSELVIKGVALCVSYFFACFLKSYKMWPTLTNNFIARLDRTDVPLKMLN